MANTMYPKNPNFLSPLGYEFSVNRARDMTFYCQSVTALGVNLIDSGDMETPFVKMNVPGTKLEYSPARFQFKVDEDMLNYREIYDWMVSMGSPRSFDQATAFEAENVSTGQGMFSDGRLLILTGGMNPNIEVVFTDMFPSALSDIEFDSKLSDVDHMVATCTFVYRDFVIRKI